MRVPKLAQAYDIIIAKRRAPCIVFFVHLHCNPANAHFFARTLHIYIYIYIYTYTHILNNKHIRAYAYSKISFCLRDLAVADDRVVAGVGQDGPAKFVGRLAALLSYDRICLPGLYLHEGSCCHERSWQICDN